MSLQSEQKAQLAALKRLQDDYFDELSDMINFPKACHTEAQEFRQKQRREFLNKALVGIKDRIARRRREMKGVHQGGLDLGAMTITVKVK